MRPVVILGGYGNFGKRIAAALARSDVPVVVAGRNGERAGTLAADLGNSATGVAVDIGVGLPAALADLAPSVVVNTVGPFQTANYRVAEACVAAGVHYVDLADGRTFVTGIGQLDGAARAAGVAVISGASTVPGLSSAVLDRYCSDFAPLDTLRYGITPGQKAERGLATTRGILTYVGRPLAPHPGMVGQTYGWQGLHRQDYPRLGRRWMADCEVPDLDLLPERYGLTSIRFSAGLELGALHLGLWGLSWLVRSGLPLGLPRHAELLLAASNLFNVFGSADGGMHMVMSGRDHDGRPLERRWFIVARNGDGPHIPTVPAIVLARAIAQGNAPEPGARPCLGLVSLEDYLAELAPYAIRTYER